MTPYHADDWLTMYAGDCRAVMAAMGSESIQSVVTSPPYWGLRDYGVDGQLGMEPTPEAYVASMVEVFREVRRVLRRDGTVWLNLGDSYASKTRGSDLGWDKSRLTNPGYSQKAQSASLRSTGERHRGKGSGLKEKDRMMIPARCAIALQADGWWLRDEIVWAKPNAMPSSVEDRTTPAHEMVYLLTRSARYHYDAAAIRERAESGPSDLRKMAEGRDRIGGLVLASNDPKMAASGRTNVGRKRSVGGAPLHRQGLIAATDREASLVGSVSESTERQVVGINARWDDAEANGTAPIGRNKRSVWTVATEPYPGAHFATFPTALIEPMILAGTPPGGIVLDPFGGSGTVAVVAQRLGRKAVLIDLSPDYCAQAMSRIGRARGNGEGPAIDMPIPSPAGSLWAATS